MAHAQQSGSEAQSVDVGKYEYDAHCAECHGLSRNSPDESQTGVNIRAFPAFPQDSREVRTATGASGSPNGGRGADLAIFPGIWTHSSRRALERMTIERLTLALVVAVAVVQR
jgi:mono/diheme cytochrome c family protein